VSGNRKSALFGVALHFAFRDPSIVIFTEGLGPQKFHGRAVLLVNQHTASAPLCPQGNSQPRKFASTFHRSKVR